MGHEQNLIQRGDLLQRLLRGLEIKGQRSASLTLDPNVVPVVMLENLEDSQFLEPKSPGWFYAQRPGAVAGQLTGIGISNSNPEVIVVVERCEVVAAVSLDFDLYTSTNAGAEGGLATIEFASWADTRRAGTPPFIAIYGSSVAGVAPVENVINRLRWVSGANPTVLVENHNPVIVGPGKALVLQTTTANAAFQAVFAGRVISKS